MTDKRKVLLVDDDRHLLRVLKDYLEFEGFEVVTAASGEEGLKRLDKMSPDVIILDISMPGIGGIGFLRRITGREGKPSHPVLVLTARSEMAAFFDSVQVDGFLPKPCDEETLAGKIREIVSSARQKVQAGGSKEAQPRLVLLAEDDEHVAVPIVRDFESAGYRLEVVDSGPAVIEKAAVLKPDLIIMKNLLPRMNGTVCAPLLKSMPNSAYIPIVIYDTTRTIGEGTATPEGVSLFTTSANPRALLRAAKELIG